MLKLFTDHPHSVGETYTEHMGFAFRFGAKMMRGSLACFVHGVAPFLCTTKGSRTVLELTAMMTRGARANTSTGKEARRGGEPEYSI